MHLLPILVLSSIVTALPQQNPAFKSCPEIGKPILAISNFQTLESDAGSPGNSSMHFDFRDTMTNLSTSCWRNLTSSTGGDLEKLVEPEKTSQYLKYHACNDPRVRFIYGETGGLAITEQIICNG